MAHAQKPDFVFRRNGRVRLNRRRRQFSRLLAAEVCASAVVLLDTPCSEVVWRVLATHSIRQFPLHFPSRARYHVPSHFNWGLTECLYTNRFSLQRLLLFLSDANLFCYSVRTYKQPPAFSFLRCGPLMTLTNETSDFKKLVAKCLCCFLSFVCMKINERERERERERGGQRERERKEILQAEVSLCFVYAWRPTPL